MAAVKTALRTASPRNNVCAPAVVERFLPYVSPDDIAEVFHIMTWEKVIYPTI